MKKLLQFCLFSAMLQTAYAQDTFVIEDGDPEEAPLLLKSEEQPRVFNLDFKNARINVEQILHTGIVVDEIPTLLNPKFTTFEDAITDENLKNDDYAIAVDIYGEMRIYPLSILNWHQGVNDEVNGEAIFVSWDPLSGQPLAVKRRTAGAINEFGVSGLVYRSTTLYYDRMSQSLWSPMLKKAVTGPLSNYKFEEFPAFIAQVSSLKEAYPEAKILSRKTGYVRDYSTNPYGTYGRDKTMLFPVKYYDASMPRKEYVMGVTLRRGGVERHVAFPIASLMEWKNAKGHKFTFGSDILPGSQPMKMTVHYMEPLGRFEVSTPHADVQIDHTYSYWFIWSAYHPETHVIRYFDEQYQ